MQATLIFHFNANHTAYRIAPVWVRGGSAHVRDSPDASLVSRAFAVTPVPALVGGHGSAKAPTWLYLRAADEPIVAAGKSSRSRTCSPRCAVFCPSIASGNAMCIAIIAIRFASGERFPSRAAISACGVIVISAQPAAIPFAIFRAACLADAEAPGMFAARLNHRYSRAESPVK